MYNHKARLRNALATYLYNIILNWDVDGNVYVLGLIVVLMKATRLEKYVVPAAGNAHYSISQTLAEMRERDIWGGCLGCYILTKVWGLWIRKRPYDHCTDAMAGVPEDETVG